MAGHLGTATLKTMAQASIPVQLRSGEAQIIPNGDWIIQPGAYTTLQYYDPVGQVWRSFGPSNSECPTIISSDGTNYRFFNISGTVVGGVVTNGGTANAAKNGIWPAGSNSVTGVTVTTTAGANAPAGTQLFNAIVGGAVSATVTVTAGGVNYVLPPLVTFSNPPAGGLAATGYAVLTAGVVTSIVVTNQGAGYASTPSITLTNEAGDIGSGAAATAILDAAQSGKLVAVTLANNAGGYATVPTLTIAGLAGSPAVTAIMALSVVTATTVSSATNQTASQLVYVAQLTGGTNTTTNPAYTTGLIGIRNGLGVYNTSATMATQAVLDGGISQIDSSNLCVAISSPTAASGTATYGSGASGGINDLSWLAPL
jgi:hypothetical protein